MGHREAALEAQEAELNGALSKQFGLQKPGKVNSWSVVPDTGAQICVGGTVLLNRLNLMERDLIPASQEISAANEAEMKIMGGVILMVGEEKLSTKVLCYISRECKGMYLSLLSAYRDLTLIPHNFPSPIGREDGAKAAQALVQGLVGGGEEAGAVIHEVAACGCPIRAAPPSLPDSIREYGGKVERMQDWILQRLCSCFRKIKSVRFC